MMHQRISKKILVYLFFIVLLTSINNKKILESNPFDLKNFYIDGLDGVELINLNKKINQFYKKNIFFLNEKILSQNINEINTIENYSVFRKYPSYLKISIVKTKFFAILNINGNSFLIGTNGKLIQNFSNRNDLPLIFGNPSNQEILEIYKIIINSKFEFKDIKNLFFFKSGRWDIETLNGVVLKLPVKNLSNLFQDEFILNAYKDLRYSTIDLRVPNQIIFYDR